MAILTRYAAANGKPCFDAADLAVELAMQGRHDSAALAAGANRVHVPIGPNPGFAELLMRRKDLLDIQKGAADQADRTTRGNWSIEVNDGVRKLTLPKWVFVSATRLSGGVRIDHDSPMLVTLADRRVYGAVRAPAAVVVANLPGTDPTRTWEDLARNLWTQCESFLGAWPGLPTPRPTGKPFAFHSWENAYRDLNAVLHRCGCDLRYKPEAATFDLINRGSTDATGTDAALAAGDNVLAADDETLESDVNVPDGLARGCEGTTAFNVRTTRYWQGGKPASENVAEPASWPELLDEKNRQPLDEIARNRANQLNGGGRHLRRTFNAVLRFTLDRDLSDVIYSVGPDGAQTTVARERQAIVPMPPPARPWPKLRGRLCEDLKEKGKARFRVDRIAEVADFGETCGNPFGVDPVPGDIYVFEKRGCAKGPSVAAGACGGDPGEAFWDGGLQRYEFFPVCDDGSCDQTTTPPPTPTPTPGPNPTPGPMPTPGPGPGPVPPPIPDPLFWPPGPNSLGCALATAWYTWFEASGWQLTMPCPQGCFSTPPAMIGEPGQTVPRPCS